jgi:hypothetical protein
MTCDIATARKHAGEQLTASLGFAKPSRDDKVKRPSVYPVTLDQEFRMKFASTSTAAHSAHNASGASAAAALTTHSEVRKVDKEQREVTLEHGPISNLKGG